MKKTVFSLAAVTAAVTAPIAHASEVEPIIVTATRTAQTVDQSLASVTVITREDIEASQAVTLDEMLDGHIGIEVANRGGHGKNSSMFLRGTNSNHTLFMIDGLKIGSATLGTVQFQKIPLGQIERIEIVRGPRSSLYGSEAIGGVIQIFTRKGARAYDTIAELGAGSNNLKQGSIATSGSHGNTEYAFSLSLLDTDGIDAFDDGENDRDGYKSNSASLRVTHEFDNGLEAKGYLLHSESEDEYDGWLNSTDFIQQTYGLTLAYPMNDLWYSSLTLGKSVDDADNFNQGAFLSMFKTERTNLNWQNDLAIDSSKTLTLGLDHQQDEVESTTAYPVTERDNNGYFAQYQAQTGAHDYLVSLRNDDNQAFGHKTTSGISWGYNYSDNLRVTASYGSAFKAPTFNDLYFTGIGGQGNPNLKPEESDSIELGVRHKTSNAIIEANAYQTDIENLIDWSCVLNCATPSFWDDIWQPLNLSSAEIRGLELRVGTTLMGWASNVEVSWTDPRDAQTDKVLQLRSKRNARLDLSRDFGRTTVGVEVLAKGMRFKDASNSTTLGGYGLVNLRGEWSVAKSWTIKAKINNITDKDYEPVRLYNTAGRTIFIGVSYATL